MARPKRGEGTIYREKGRRTWMMRYYDADDVRRRESTGTTDKQLAKRRLESRLGEVADGRHFPRADRITVLELLDDVVVEYKTNHRKTLYDLERRISRHLRPALGDRRVHDLDATDIRAYVLDRQEAGAANATINRELSVLGRAFALGVAASKVVRVPRVEKLREADPRSGFFSEEEVDRVCAELPDYLRAPVVFAFVLGWRKGEVLGLTWDRVDLVEGTVRLDTGMTKSGRGREVHMPQRLRTLLNRLRVERDVDYPTCPWVFHRVGDEIRSMHTAWRGACKRAGFEGRLFHDLRRSAARTMLQRGLPQRLAMHVTGHITDSIFRRYAIVDRADSKRAAELLDRAGAAEPTVSDSDSGSGVEAGIVPANSDIETIH